MSPDLSRLARDVAALSGWRWMLGMTSIDGWLIVGADYADDGSIKGIAAMDERGDFSRWIMVDGCLCGNWLPIIGPIPASKPLPAAPLLTDPATAGCLLFLLGDAVSTVYGPGEEGSWQVSVYRDGAGHDEPRHGITLGEACARAALALGRWPGGTP